MACRGAFIKVNVIDGSVKNANPVRPKIYLWLKGALIRKLI
jgi:hypothetical protein